MHRRFFAPIILLALSGCLTPVTRRLDRMNCQLQTTNQQLGAVNDRLDAANCKLQETNQRLGTVEEQLRDTNKRLQAVEQALKRISGLGP